MTKTKKVIDWRIVIVGLSCLTVIEVCALLKGIDGTLLSVIIGIIALAIGVVIPNPIK